MLKSGDSRWQGWLLRLLSNTVQWWWAWSDTAGARQVQERQCSECQVLRDASHVLVQCAAAASKVVGCGLWIHLLLLALSSRKVRQRLPHPAPCISCAWSVVCVCFVRVSAARTLCALFARVFGVLGGFGFLVVFLWIQNSSCLTVVGPVESKVRAIRRYPFHPRATSIGGAASRKVRASPPA